MRIILIHPGPSDDQGFPMRLSRLFMRELTLPYLAALIPAHHQLRIIADGVERVDFNEPADAVMLTAITSRAERAYQIADGFRERGVKVIMGGIHATMFPDEASTHVDAVAVGEAEGLIEELLDDLEAGRLKKRYEAQRREDLSGLPPPRYDLLRDENYMVRVDPVQAVRGCPNRCRHCSVHLVQGMRLRKRPVEDVVRDLSRTGPLVYFVDDNIMADRTYALELIHAIRPLGKIWGAQSDISFGADQELVREARRAGCVTLFIGLESVDQENLLDMNKKINLRTDLGRSLHNLHRAGIGVMASCMAGFDRDTPEAMDELVAFLEAHRVPTLFLFILSALPGTALREELAREGRLLELPWRCYDAAHVTFKPKHMSSEELLELYWRTYQRFYSAKSMARRLLWPPQIIPFAFDLLARRSIAARVHPITGFPTFPASLSRLMSWVARDPTIEKIRRAVGRG